MKLNDVLETLRSIAPEHLAEPWDKVGLHVGDPAQRVRRAMLCIDLTESVLDEAVKAKANLVVAYHPVIFEPPAQLTGATWKQRVLREAIRRNIAIYCPHTALDAAEGGVNDFLAEAVGPGAVRPIRPGAAPGGYKLVTFVPEARLDGVRRAMAAAGAGRIGDYGECSFASPGEGTFHGGATTRPAVGRAGRLERVAEHRLEMVVPGGAARAVIAALAEAHPYEEPAFDLVPLAPIARRQRTGQGRVVRLDRAVSLDTLVSRLKKGLDVKHLEVVGRGRVRTVGVCAGAGGSLLAEAGDVDAFVTGEMRHHDQVDAAGRGVTVILAGHSQTERPYLRTYRRRILAAGSAGRVDWRLSRRDRPPSTRR